MSQFSWEELQSSIITDCLVPGQKFCTTDAQMEAKKVVHFSPSDILTLQKGWWVEVVTSDVLGLPLSAWNPHPMSKGR